jgi:tRNA pseudouridine32 synthase/23S rRNA pseudouridine746 synthase
VLKHLTDPDDGYASSLVELVPLTGRTHQLRVHMLHIGHPMLGDTLYATGQDLAKSPRLLLHAHKLRIRHPSTNEVMNFCAKCEFVSEDLKAEFPDVFPFVPGDP